MWLKRESENGSGAEGTPWEHGRLTRGYRRRRVLDAAGEHRVAPGTSTDKTASGSTHRTSRMLRKSYRMAGDQAETQAELGIGQQEPVVSRRQAPGRNAVMLGSPPGGGSPGGVRRGCPCWAGFAAPGAERPSVTW